MVSVSYVRMSNFISGDGNCPIVKINERQEEKNSQKIVLMR